MDLLTGLKHTIARLGYAKIAALGIVLVATISFLGLVANFSVEPKRVLYADLDPTDIAKIGQKLDELKIPFEVKGDGTAISVPASQVARVRMDLAGAGLPRQSGAGYDLLDQQSPMNMTSFMQRIQRLRALEGELARSIVTLGSVHTARVHIVLPERESFARDTPKPTASVVVTMAGPGRLGTPQAAAIRLLVAGAVPGMAAESVSVLDPTGVVIGADDSEGAESGRLTELKGAREHKLQDTVTALLEPLIGHNKVRVAAAVELDNSREVAREEKFDPLSQVERSKQTQSDQDTTTESKGQDPVSVSQNLPNQAAAAQPPGDAGKTTASNTRNGQTINYEISSVKSERIREAGDLKRMTIAVVVDGVVDDKGQYQPRPHEELARLAELIQSAVGFDANRGDRVTVETMRFVPEPATGTSADADAGQTAQLPIVWIVAGGVLLVLVAAGAFVLLRSRKSGGQALVARDAEAIPLGLPGSTSPQPLPLAAAQATPAIAQAPPVFSQLAAPGADGTPAASPAMLTNSAGEAHATQPTLAKLFELIDTRPDEAAATLRSWLAGVP
ncbi:MAG: flagellar M-ring protein FliF [Alphaproteobacteria bacterium]|nr:flagellar M-ring protein FliF [Alphaproteobacteria bacterium]